MVGCYSTNGLLKKWKIGATTDLHHGSLLRVLLLPLQHYSKKFMQFSVLGSFVYFV